MEKVEDAIVDTSNEIKWWKQGGAIDREEDSSTTLILHTIL